MSNEFQLCYYEVTYLCKMHHSKNASLINKSNTIFPFMLIGWNVICERILPIPLVCFEMKPLKQEAVQL